MARITTPELAQAFIDEQVAAIREQVGDKKVLLALSGGVDSSVVAALLIKAIGKQLICVHVNHGLMRKGESEQVIDVFQQPAGREPGLRGRHRPLPGQAGRRRASPRHKRKIIGAEFIRVFEEEARKVGDEVELPGPGHHLPRHPGVQGRREGAPQRGRPARRPAVRAGASPCKLLFKDEVRVVGRDAGPARDHGRAPALPRPRPGRALPGRHHPRPPGGAARGRRHRARGDATAAGRGQVWQYFAVVPDLRATGVRDGVRAYEWPGHHPRHQHRRRHDRRGPRAATGRCSSASPTASPPRSPASAACATTSPPSPSARWSGNKPATYRLSKAPCSLQGAFFMRNRL